MLGGTKWMNNHLLKGYKMGTLATNRLMLKPLSKQTNDNNENNNNNYDDK